MKPRAPVRSFPRSCHLLGIPIIFTRGPPIPPQQKAGKSPTHPASGAPTGQLQGTGLHDFPVEVAHQRFESAGGR